MPVVQTILGLEEVNAYLITHGFERGGAAITHALLLRGGTLSGQPAVALVVDLGGREVLVKTSLQTIETIATVMRAASDVERPL
jgi:hypothetical protein